MIHLNYLIYLNTRETGLFLKKLITHDEKDTIFPAYSSILLGHIRPSSQQEVPRLRALHPQMSQGRVIDIIIIGSSYSLQYYSFWKGTQIIGI